MKTFPIVLTLFLSACASHHHDPVNPPKKVVSDMHSDKYPGVKGTVTIEDLPKEYKITTDLSGLKPQSRLGFHVHQNGACEGPDYKSAGDHFNPHHLPHGSPAGHKKHSGDFGNLMTNAQGESKQEFIVPKEDGEGIDKLVNKSVLIHAKADDLKTQPAGNSGDRVACGIIKPI